MALAVAMGIGRFAFTPLMPLMVRDGLLGADAGAWMAASNYLGYLLGAMLISRLPVQPVTLLGGSLIGITALTAAMGLTSALPMWVLLRFLAGVLSAWALVATSAWALGRLAQMGRPHLAGVVFAGVGLGIAMTGVFCLVEARPGVSADRLWLELAALAALAIAVPLVLTRGPLATPPALRTTASPPVDNTAGRNLPAGITGLVICYGLFGFGYILPATFLPGQARQLVDDPQVFGWAWPLFGLAAVLSTLLTAWGLKNVDRLRVWAVSHVLMAVGVLLPSLWLSLTSIAVAALLVGGTFMVITLVGMQAARAHAPSNPTAILARMTAAFALGQLAGPMFSATLGLLPVGHGAALNHTLQLAALGLLLSAVYLWRMSRLQPHQGTLS
jgi:MFS family permease